MKRILILVPHSAVMEAVAGPRYLFTAVNQFAKASGLPPLFDVQLVSASRKVKVEDGIFSIRADLLLHEASSADLVIVPALSGNMKEAVEANRKAIPWLLKQYGNGAEIASLCVGAFLLASTGLLNGRHCSTHWAFVNEFRETYPEVEVVDGSIITDEKGLYSSGGANSYWNLMLYLLEKYANRDMAILAAKYFAVDIDRENQSAFMMFNGQKGHPDEKVKKAQVYIEDNASERITVDQLAEMLAVSRRSFERRFKKATHNTVAKYVQRVKVEAAKRSLELSLKNVNEVMYDVGYTDNKAFRMAFKKITGLTPVEYRNKYYKEELKLAMN